VVEQRLRAVALSSKTDSEWVTQQGAWPSLCGMTATAVRQSSGWAGLGWEQSFASSGRTGPVGHNRTLATSEHPAVLNLKPPRTRRNATNLAARLYLGSDHFTALGHLSNSHLYTSRAKLRQLLVAKLEIELCDGLTHQATAGIAPKRSLTARQTTLRSKL
jgi:hypothetical protein